LRKFENITSKVQSLDRGFKKSANTYDPTKYVRANRLLHGINVNDLPEVKHKDKYSYDDYLKSKSGQGGQGGQGGALSKSPQNYNNTSSSQNKSENNFSFDGKFSYDNYKEQYLNKSQAGKNNSNVNNNIDGFNDFDHFQNSFSNSNNITNPNLPNKSQINTNEMRHTTIIPQNDTSFDQKGMDAFNPYSSITLNQGRSVINNVPDNFYNQGHFNLMNNPNNFNNNSGFQQVRQSNVNVQPQIGSYSQINFNNNTGGNSIDNPYANLKFPK
jgi:hypothetical protein